MGAAMQPNACGGSLKKKPQSIGANCTMKRLILIAVLVIMAMVASAASAQGDMPGSLGCGYAPNPRLVPGEQGRVTPGLPNVLRSQPYRGGASYVLGEIPAGATFTVLAGYAAQCGNG